MTRIFEQKDIEYNYQIANNFINKMLAYADYYVKQRHENPNADLEEVIKTKKKF